MSQEQFVFAEEKNILHKQYRKHDSSHRITCISELLQIIYLRGFT